MCGVCGVCGVCVCGVGGWVCGCVGVVLGVFNCVCWVCCVCCVEDFWWASSRYSRPRPPLRRTAQNFALFFSLPPEISFFLLSLEASPDSPRTPNVHISGPRPSKAPPKCHEKTPHEREERMKFPVGERKKSAKFWAPHPLGPTTHHTHNEHPTSPPKKKMAKCGLAKCGQLSLAKCGIGQIRFGQMRSRPLDTVDRRKPNVTELIGPRLGTVSSKLYEIVTFHQKNFHQNPLSSKTTFIQTTFIQTTFIRIHFPPKPLSSKNHFHKNRTFCSVPGSGPIGLQQNQ